MDQNINIYYIAAGLKKLGPFSQSQLQDYYNQSKISSRDRVYDSHLKKWFTVNDVLVAPALSLGAQDLMKDMLHGHQNQEAPRPTQPVRATKNTWYVQEAKFILGPYSYFSMISMILDNHITPKTLVKRSLEDQWAPLLHHFPQEQTEFYHQALVTKPGAIPKFNRRKNERFVYNEIFSLNDGQSEYVVRGVDISVKSIAFFVLEAEFSPQQTVSCRLMLDPNEMKSYRGKILRVEQIKSETADLSLQKCIFIPDEDFDLDALEEIQD